MNIEVYLAVGVGFLAGKYGTTPIRRIWDGFWYWILPPRKPCITYYCPFCKQDFAKGTSYGRGVTHHSIGVGTVLTSCPTCRRDLRYEQRVRPDPANRGF